MSGFGAHRYVPVSTEPKESHRECHRHRVHHPGRDRVRPGRVRRYATGRLGIQTRPGGGRRRQVQARQHAGRGGTALGRATWQLFSRLWPGRDDPFAAQMNAVPKLVVSCTLTHADLSAWANSQLLEGDSVAAVKRERRDVVDTGSLSVADRLMAADVVDEYRLLTFPTVLGTGRRLFPTEGPTSSWSAWPSSRPGPAVLTRCRRTSEGCAAAR
ncbi:dihydrofolate reductase family protein [Streptomyces sp. NPDC060011]|uniref:dihydrofolate reductase family protein n=1 Tax=Streptomyces sp. NPDC060011 TaxID=3347037 RepID=UPI0036A70556